MSPFRAVIRHLVTLGSLEETYLWVLTRILISDTKTGTQKDFQVSLSPQNIALHCPKKDKEELSVEIQLFC